MPQAPLAYREGVNVTAIYKDSASVDHVAECSAAQQSATSTTRIDKCRVRWWQTSYMHATSTIGIQRGCERDRHLQRQRERRPCRGVLCSTAKRNKHHTNRQIQSQMAADIIHACHKHHWHTE